MAEGDEASEQILSKDVSEAQEAGESSLVDYISKCDRIDRHDCWIYRKKKEKKKEIQQIWDTVYTSADTVFLFIKRKKNESNQYRTMKLTSIIS